MANKKDFILDTAQKLFMEQGFDQTSISQILEATQIARGTLYYYFSSKEEIMDAIIERTIERAFTASQAFADNRELTIIERLVGSMAALNLNHQDGKEVLLHLNQPQNALLHEKTNQILLERAPQILLPIIQDGGKFLDGKFFLVSIYLCTNLCNKLCPIDSTILTSGGKIGRAHV